MSKLKRHATGASRSRKKRRGGSSYASIDLDSPDKHAGEVEVIRVWDVTRSVTTGRVSATCTAHRHIYEGPSKPLCEEPASVVKDVDISPDPEPSGQAPTKGRVKRKPRVRIVKENDSVSSTPIPSSNKLIVTRLQTRMADWFPSRPIMLDELFRDDGLGDSTAPGPCEECMELVGEYRCNDCPGGDMYCPGCIVSSHRKHPLHRVEVRREFAGILTAVLKIYV